MQNVSGNLQHKHKKKIKIYGIENE
jgi:hypothetical protein